MNGSIQMLLGSPPSAWTPSDIVGLEVFNWCSIGNCYVSDGGAVSAIDGQVGYVEPLYGTTNALSTASNKPTLKADGLQFAADGSSRLAFDTPIVFDASTTLYLVAKMDTGATFTPVLSDDVGLGYIGSDDAGATIYFDDSASGGSFGINPGGLVLIKTSADSLAVVTGQITGDVASAPGSTPSTHNQIAGTSAVDPSFSNASLANRYLLYIFINRLIADDSTEDLYIRAWILANCGVLFGDGVVIVNDSNFRTTDWPGLVIQQNGLIKGNLRIQGCGAQQMNLPNLTAVLGAGDFNTGSVTDLASAAPTLFSAPLLVTHEGYLGVHGSLFVAQPVCVIDLTSLQTAHYFYIEGVGIETLALPAFADDLNSFELLDCYNLTSANLGGMATVERYLEIGNNSALTSLTAASLNADDPACEFWEIYNNDALTTLSLPGLTESACLVQIRDHAALTSLNIANLASIADTTGFFAANDNPLLATVTVGASIATDEMLGFEIKNCALNQASVDAILAALNAGKGVAASSPTIDLTGGTNAVPSAAGLVSKAALEVAGYIVNVNS